MNRVMHFEIHADDMDSAEKFYKSVFGWGFEHMGPEFGNYVVIRTGDPMPDSKDPGINGGMIKRNAPKPIRRAIFLE